MFRYPSLFVGWVIVATLLLSLAGLTAEPINGHAERTMVENSLS